VDRFGVGDRVRVLDDVPGGNPRTPHYLRGRTGTVVRAHGVVENPLDHRDTYPPLYTVVFPAGRTRSSPTCTRSGSRRGEPEAGERETLAPQLPSEAQPGM
jgi:hypothetical protein